MAFRRSAVPGRPAELGLPAGETGRSPRGDSLFSARSAPDRGAGDLLGFRLDFKTTSFLPLDLDLRSSWPELPQSGPDCFSSSDSSSFAYEYELSSSRDHLASLLRTASSAPSSGGGRFLGGSGTLISCFFLATSVSLASCFLPADSLFLTRLSSPPAAGSFVC